MLAPWKKNYDIPKQWIKKVRYHFDDKNPYSQSYGFSSSCVWLWELDHKEDWVLKNWCFQIVVLKKTLESALDSKEIQLVNHKGNQPRILIGRLILKLKLQYFGHLMQRPTHWKRPWCWERLKAKWEEGGRGWDSYILITSLTQWTWNWANSGRRWRTGKCCSPWGCKEMEMT